MTTNPNYQPDDDWMSLFQLDELAAAEAKLEGLRRDVLRAEAELDKLRCDALRAEIHNCADLIACYVRRDDPGSLGDIERALYQWHDPDGLDPETLDAIRVQATHLFSEVRIGVSVRRAMLTMPPTPPALSAGSRLPMRHSGSQPVAAAI
jgi:hypothetical protein